MRRGQSPIEDLAGLNAPGLAKGGFSLFRNIPSFTVLQDMFHCFARNIDTFRAVR